MATRWADAAHTLKTSREQLIRDTMEAALAGESAGIVAENRVSDGEARRAVAKGASRTTPLASEDSPASVDAPFAPASAANAAVADLLAHAHIAELLAKAREGLNDD